MNQAGPIGNATSSSGRGGKRPVPHAQGRQGTLKVHQKKRKTSKNDRTKSLNERLEALTCSPDPSDREQLLQTLLMLHERFPSDESQRHVETWVSRLELERQIARDSDPVTFDQAIARARQDVDSLFDGKDKDAIRSHLFSVLSTEAEPLSGRSDVESRWMTRWVLGRRVDKWSKLVGFAGEYLVYRLFEFLLPNFQTSDWTSSMRKLAYPDTTPFSDSASSADFTYLDSEKELAKVLNIQTTGIKEFHIEVKTSKEAENGFVFTSRQLRTMREMHINCGKDRDQVYVILKVDNAAIIRDARITQIIENPLQSFLDGRMDFSCDGMMRASWKDPQYEDSD